MGDQDHSGRSGRTFKGNVEIHGGKKINGYKAKAKKKSKIPIEAYLAKDEFGDYMIPQIRQRPILLMGPPGNQERPR